MTLAAPTEHERTLALLRGPDLLAIAPRLLGAVLRVGSAEGVVGVRLTEVEAYAGEVDPGSHAYRGRTARTAPMFEAGGLLYVYFTYGMHWCANLVTGAGGTAAAVLLRAGEVVEGLDVARGRRPGASDRDLARGPARLCRALGITLDLDGADLGAGPVGITPGAPPAEVSSGPRVGLRGAPDRPWRFWSTGERSVSAYRPATRRPRERGPDLSS